MPPTSATNETNSEYFTDWDEDENKTSLRTSSLISIIAPNVEKVDLLRGCYIQEAYFPKATVVADKAFANSECLKKVTLADGAVIGEKAFRYCCGLRELNAKGIKSIAKEAFYYCNRLRSIDLSEVTEIGVSGLWEMRQLKGSLTIPKLKTLGAYGISETVTSLCLPEAEHVGHYPVLGEDIRLIVSSKMAECPLRKGLLDFSDWDIQNQLDYSYKDYYYYYYYYGIYDYKNLKIYGTPNTYAQQFAKTNKYTFIALPLLESEPENMGCQSAGNITADVLGFNKEYQWYGTNRKDNHGGYLLSGENEETLDTSKYNYRYYYCIVKTSDGDYKKDIITGVSDLSYYNYQQDKSINILDISLLLMHLGESVVSSNKQYDINEDGVIDIADASILLNSDLYGMRV